MGRISKQDYYMEFSKTASLRSNCLRAKVGAVIIKDGRIIATGYNGAPSGVVSCDEKGYCYRIENNIPSGTQYSRCHSIHAENNAVIQVGRYLCKGADIYIYGHSFICVMCKRVLINAGIVKAYLKKDESQEKMLEFNVEDFKEELSCCKCE